MLVREREDLRSAHALTDIERLVLDEPRGVRHELSQLDIRHPRQSRPEHPLTASRMCSGMRLIVPASTRSERPMPGGSIRMTVV